MTEYPATEADTQPTDPQPDQPAETGPELPEDQRIPDDEAELLTEDPTAPNPYTDEDEEDPADIGEPEFDPPFRSGSDEDGDA